MVKWFEMVEHVCGHSLSRSCRTSLTESSSALHLPQSGVCELCFFFERHGDQTNANTVRAQSAPFITRLPDASPPQSYRVPPRVHRVPTRTKHHLLTPVSDKQPSLKNETTFSRSEMRTITRSLASWRRAIKELCLQVLTIKTTEMQ